MTTMVWSLIPGTDEEVFTIEGLLVNTRISVKAMAWSLIPCTDEEVFTIEGLLVNTR